MPAIKWLERNGAEPAKIITTVLAKLAQRGRHLPKDQRILYAKKVVLGEFLARWASKHHGTTVQKLSENDELNESEMRPFHLAMILAGDASVFRRIIPRLTRQRIISDCGGNLGNETDFSCFVVDYSGVLAHRFLSNFDPKVSGAAAKAVRYMEMTAVSHYLHMGMEISRTVPGLARYLDESKKLGWRTKLAAKLAYLPAALSDAERKVLRERYGVTGSLVRRIKIKAIANLPGYPSAAVLSRKLYRARQWARNQTAEAPTEVRY